MKSRRHLAIMDIVNNEKVGTQEDLCESLQRRGFAVTQATVSRDIRELKLIKIADQDGYRYALPDATTPRSSAERMKRLFSDAVVNVDYSENIIVIKTLPGTAHAVASTVDTSGMAEVVGTVAGDDTIFVVVKPKQAVPQIIKRFNDLIK
ncbi:MAG: arginine repressor [Candidatus Saccharibacteria bacterium]